jgi:hypothetical protein
MIERRLSEVLGAWKVPRMEVGWESKSLLDYGIEMEV